MLAYPILAAIAVTSMFAQHITASPPTGATSSPPDTVDNSYKAWGQFCNDSLCSDCGTWVDLSNSDCLQETSRQAVNIKTNGPGALVALIVSVLILITSPTSNSRTTKDKPLNQSSAVEHLKSLSIDSLLFS